MLLLFLTDLHTGLEGEYPHDIDLRQNFLDVLRATSRHQYDYLVLGGDLCLKNGNADIYQWQKEKLDELGVPYFIVPGNHDDQKILSQVFSHLSLTTESEIYSHKILNNHSVLFLDTARGFMSDTQKAWLRKKLKELDSEQLVIFMHHPPSLMQVPHMDHNYALRDRSEVLELFKETDKSKLIFCGHYHVEKSVFIDNISIHVTPSLFFQIDQHDEEFSVDHLNVGYRLINFERDKILTTVHYIAGNSSS